MITDNIKYIVGIEAGESGGNILSSVLSGIPHSDVRYKMSWKDNKYNSGILPWKFDISKAERKLNALKGLGYNLYNVECQDSYIVGDVGHYYLNYVEYLLNKLPELKIIAIYRERNENINELMSRVEPDNFKLATNPEQRSYPDINCVTTDRERFEYYYNFYSNAIDSLMRYYPTRIHAIDFDDVHKYETIQDILTFIYD